MTRGRRVTHSSITDSLRVDEPRFFDQFPFVRFMKQEMIMFNKLETARTLHSSFITVEQKKTTERGKK